MKDMNCPYCEVKYEKKPQLIEIEDEFTNNKLFNCNKCKTTFELREVDE